MYEYCAYFENKQCVSGLVEHSLAVCRLANHISTRLLGRPMPVIDRSLLSDALVIASLMHDVGKASRIYQERRGGFGYHEYVGAVLLAESYEHKLQEDDTTLGAVLLAAAGAVARHHSAIEDRHPRTILDPNKSWHIVRKTCRAIQGMPHDILHQLLPPPLARLLSTALESLQQDCDMMHVETLIRTIINPTTTINRRKMNLAPAIYLLSGTLITADILAASIERQERVTKAYARSWLHELGLSVDTIKLWIQRGDCTTTGFHA